TNETPFLVVFLLYAFYSWLAFPLYTQYIAIPLVFWAGLIFLAKLIRFKLKFIKHSVFGLVWCVAYAVTIVLNRHYSPLGEQIRSLIWLFVFCVVIYSACYQTDKAAPNMVVVSWTTRLFTMLASGFSLYTYYARWLPWLEMPDQTYALVGFLNHRLFGVYVDPNFGALFATLSLTFSLYYFVEKRRRLGETLFNLVNAIIQLLYIGLSYSRTGLVILIVTGSLFLIGFGVNAFRNREHTRIRLVREITLRSLAFILVIFLIWKPFWDMDRARSLGYLLFDIPLEEQLETESQSDLSKSGSRFKNKSDGTRRSAQVVALLEQENRSDTESSGNERIVLMQEGIELLLHKPIFGVGDRNIRMAAQEFMPDSLLAYGKVPHNAYIFVILASGLVGGLICFIWLIQSALLFFKTSMFKKRLQLLAPWYAVIPIVICLISSLFLQDLFLTMSPSAFIFWFFLGYIRRSSRTQPMNEKVR
ncbi:MAG TPA: hypothetical protein GX717_03585, partial [Clostridiaceae bacterium]|nr:hypothetical protein [Clostridiaceae bacterium]